MAFRVMALHALLSYFYARYSSSSQTFCFRLGCMGSDLVFTATKRKEGDKLGWRKKGRKKRGETEGGRELMGKSEIGVYTYSSVFLQVYNRGFKFVLSPFTSPPSLPPHPSLTPLPFLLPSPLSRRSPLPLPLPPSSHPFPPSSTKCNL